MDLLRVAQAFQLGLEVGEAGELDAAGGGELTHRRLRLRHPLRLLGPRARLLLPRSQWSNRSYTI